MFKEFIFPLIAGLAIFLLGMKIMEYALHQWAGHRLKDTLLRFTKTPLRGMLTGTGVTAVLQSSTAVTVMTIGLVNSRVITFSQTLGIILGTNIGTCITTELIGLELNSYAMPLLLASSAIWFASLLLQPGAAPSGNAYGRQDGNPHKYILWLRFSSLLAGGFACVMIGIEIMQTIGPVLQSKGLFAWFLERSQNSLLWGVVAGIGLTSLIHNGAATIAITMGLASIQAVSPELGIAIILGANIGTCSTAFLACIGSSKSAQFVAWSHFLLNLGGVALLFPFIPQLYAASVALSGNVVGQLAHAQTLFNIFTSLVALPICYLPVFRMNAVK